MSAPAARSFFRLSQMRCITTIHAGSEPTDSEKLKKRYSTCCNTVTKKAQAGESPPGQGEKAMIKTLYCDGGVIGHNPSGIGGTWAWTLVDDNDVRVKSGQGWVTPFNAVVPSITNNLTEMLALIYGMEELPHDFRGTICSDSAITLGRVFWGWKWSNIPTWMHHRFQEARHRLLYFDKITALQLDGHPTAAQLDAKIGKRGNPVSIHNVWCDKACGEAAQSYLMMMEPTA